MNTFEKPPQFVVSLFIPNSHTTPYAAAQIGGAVRIGAAQLSPIGALCEAVSVLTGPTPGLRVYKRCCFGVALVYIIEIWGVADAFGVKNPVREHFSSQRNNFGET